MSAIQIINSMSSGETAPLPRIYAAAFAGRPDHETGAMPMIIIAGTQRCLAWGADFPLPDAAGA